MQKFARKTETNFFVKISLMHPVATKLRKIIETKKTNLCVAADFTKRKKVLDLAEQIGDKICILKTHVDILDDFTLEFTKKLRAIAKTKKFLIFEDRKFADIGNTVKMQFQGGIYKIAEWADIVNVHPITGYGAYDGLAKSKRKGKIGILFLAQMTTEQTERIEFFNEEYAKKSFKLASSIYLKSELSFRDVGDGHENRNLPIGFIGSAEQPEILKKLRNGDFAEGVAERELAKSFLIMTPGIKLAAGGDSLGQTYNTPEKAIAAGADVIIVGRGIYQADDSRAEAEKYRAAGWSARVQ